MVYQEPLHCNIVLCSRLAKPQNFYLPGCPHIRKKSEHHCSFGKNDLFGVLLHCGVKIAAPCRRQNTTKNQGLGGCCSETGQHEYVWVTLRYRVWRPRWQKALVKNGADCCVLVLGPFFGGCLWWKPKTSNTKFSRHLGRQNAYTWKQQIWWPNCVFGALGWKKGDTIGVMHFRFKSVGKPRTKQHHQPAGTREMHAQRCHRPLDFFFNFPSFLYLLFFVFSVSLNFSFFSLLLRFFILLYFFLIRLFSRCSMFFCVFFFIIVSSSCF